MSVRVEDFSVEIKELIEREAIAWLHEWGGELAAQTIRATPQTTWHQQVAGGWTYKVDEDNLKAIVGNPYEAALWIEYGTGSESESPKGGRQGYWVYVKDGSSNGLSGDYQYSPNVYTLEEAKKIMAMLKADGLDARITKGQKAKRPLQKTFTKLKPDIIKDARERFKDLK